MSSIVHTIRLVASAQAAIAEIQKYGDVIVGAAQTVEKHTAVLSGDKLLKSANEWTAAVARLGGASDGLATSEQILAGASKLTADEKTRLNRIVGEAIDKYQALGVQAPSGMRVLADATHHAGQETGLLGSALQAIGPRLAAMFSVGAVLGFERQLVQTADSLVRLSDQTGLSIEDVQRLGYVATQSGNSLQQMADALSQMQNRLASKDTGAMAALEQLGLNVKSLMALRPAEQFMAIATAIGQVENPAKRTQLAMDLFGRSGAQILPTLTARMAELAAQAPVMSAATTRTLDQMGDDWDRFWTGWQSLVAEGWAKYKSFLDLFSTTPAATAAWREAMAALENAAPKVKPVGDALGVVNGQAKALTMSAGELARVTDQLTKSAEASIEAHEKEAARLKAVADLRAQLSGADLQEQVRNLAEAFEGLTAANKDNPDILERTAQAAAHLRAEGATLTPVLLDLALAAGRMHDGVNYVKEGLDALPGAMGPSLDAMIAGGQAALDNAQAERAWKAANDEVVDAQNKLYGATQDAAQATDDATKSVQGARGTLQLYGQTVQTVQGQVSVLGQSFSSMGAQAAASVSQMEAAARAVDSLYSRSGLIVQNTVAASQYWWLARTGTSTIPGFATGVENFGGGAALVGEGGPEIVTLPRGSSVTPLPGGSSFGAGSTTVYVDARGANFRSRASVDALARQVGDAVVARARTTGQRL